MKYFSWLFLIIFYSCGNTIYVVRHAEKAPVKPGATRQEASDPPLSEEGEARAVALKEVLKNKKVKYIFSTNYKRTKSTVAPLGDALGIPVQVYSPQKDSTDVFIQRVKSITKGNVVVAGHSNTIDDIANKIAGATVVPGDVDEKYYDNLFILKRKGSKYKFTGKKFGARSE